MHIHRHIPVREYGPNAYLECRCGARRIRHRDCGRPMNYEWLETGTFPEMPTHGPVGPAGQARAL